VDVDVVPAGRRRDLEDICWVNFSHVLVDSHDVPGSSRLPQSAARSVR
jgi:hypothetical protein